MHFHTTDCLQCNLFCRNRFPLIDKEIDRSINNWAVWEQTDSQIVFRCSWFVSMAVCAVLASALKKKDSHSTPAFSTWNLNKVSLVSTRYILKFYLFLDHSGQSVTKHGHSGCQKKATLMELAKFCIRNKTWKYKLFYFFCRALLFHCRSIGLSFLTFIFERYLFYGYFFFLFFKNQIVPVQIVVLLLIELDYKVEIIFFFFYWWMILDLKYMPV